MRQFLLEKRDKLRHEYSVSHLLTVRLIIQHSIHLHVVVLTPAKKLIPTTLSLLTTLSLFNDAFRTITRQDQSVKISTRHLFHHSIRELGHLVNFARRRVPKDISNAQTTILIAPADIKRKILPIRHTLQLILILEFNIFKVKLQSFLFSRLIRLHFLLLVRFWMELNRLFYSLRWIIQRHIFWVLSTFLNLL